MDDTDRQLMFEEQRQLLIKFNSGVDAMHELLNTIKDQYVAPPTELEVSGKVEVNTEKTVEISNIEEITTGLELMRQEVTEAIANNSHKPLTEIKVKNMADAKPTELRVSNLGEITSAFAEFGELVAKNKPVVNVVKQEVVWPNSPKKPIPVRLSDGKNFYNAIFQAIADSAPEQDPLVGYQPSDTDTAGSPAYFGFAKKDGRWYIMKEEAGAYRYARGAPLDNGGGIYSDAWTDRANLSYGYIYEVF